MLPVNLKFNGRPVTFSDSGGALPSGFTVKPVQGTSLAVHWPGRRLRGLIVQPFLAVHCHGHCAPRRTGGPGTWLAPGSGRRRRPMSGSQWQSVPAVLGPPRHGKGPAPPGHLAGPGSRSVTHWE